MQLTDLKTKSVGILGFGQEGQAVFEYLKKHGIEAKVFDQKTDPNYLDSIQNCDVLFRSPGIWRKHPKLLEAESTGTIITSQVKWFFENCQSKIIGITGTKGKGTTSSLIYETIKAGGQNTYLTGNIGKTQPLEILDDLKPTDWIVYELSSFQLQDLTQSPHIGVCLMVTSDHLNHHSDLDEYHSAKSAISGFQTEHDYCIYNADYEASKEIGQLGNGLKLIVSTKSEPTDGAFIQDETITLSKNGENQLVMDCSNRKLRGAHNLENIAASSLVCLIIGIEQGIIIKTAMDFAGLEHRLQYIGTFNDVSYYNDSISTVPETTIAALNSFKQPIHLLLGGSDKGLSYDHLVDDIVGRTNIASVCLLGETGKTIHGLLLKRNPSFPILGPYTDFDLAIKEVQKITKPQDIVLLSPATASFDMFQNYAHRGNEFVKLVTGGNNG